MNFELLNLVITSIQRVEGNQAIATTRPRENDVAGLSVLIKEKLTTLFQTTGLRLGRFNTEPARPYFATCIDDYYEPETNTFTDFRGFAENLGSSLASELSEGRSHNAKDGFLLTYFYSTTQMINFSDDDDDEELEEVINYYLCNVFLHRQDGVDIDSEDLVLRDIEQINLDSLNLGARIDITQYLQEEDDPAAKPIAFKIGRGSDVRVYFQEFVGCNEPSNSKVDTQNLSAAVELACDRFNFNEEQKRLAAEHTENYCKMILSNGHHSMSLHQFSEHVFPGKVGEFVEIANQEFGLGESIGLDKTEVNNIGIINIRNEAYTIKFNKTALSGGANDSDEEHYILWSPEENCIKLFGLTDQDINKLNLNT
ncbi:nucleoid-associated protein [Vibrio splendidus]|uniref:nucleoid-associated protein n=1 Tax=Vibrio splendidus TaxID=29497 RepID=UPI0021195B86|nr:nucleoid-associated protein [Vibrio splendidus]MCQ8868180.1 nucleoid-associated protein [Vibrio splendidus]